MTNEKYYHYEKLTPFMLTPFEIGYVYDRTSKFLKNPKGIEIITPIGDVCEPKSIDEICFDNVNRILNIVKDRKIYIAWSGGIDSTLILSEFLKYTKNDQIGILMTANSIKEYPLFYKRYIEGKLETKELSFYNDDILTECLEDGVVISGIAMDPLFGETSYSCIPKEKLIEDPVRFISKLEKQSQDRYSRFLKTCPRQIENVKDIFWWMSYALAYQNDQLVWPIQCDKLVLGENFFCFGDTKLWNDYSISTPAEVKWPGTDFSLFKIALKQQIETFTHDEEYTKYKIKVPSWRVYRDKRNNPAYITSEWKRGY